MTEVFLLLKVVIQYALLSLTEDFLQELAWE